MDKKELIALIRSRFYNQCFEKDTDDKDPDHKWESGLWVRYRLIERILDELEEVNAYQFTPV